MSNNAIVTRCPQCQTAFRVTLSQLSVAKGAVRCGSCLGIFRAADHEVGANTVDLKPASAPTTSESQSKQESPALDLDLVNDEMLEDNAKEDVNIDQGNDDFYFFDKESAGVVKKSSIFGTTASNKPLTSSRQEKADESWALDMLAELEDDEDEELSSISFVKPVKESPTQVIDNQHSTDASPNPKKQNIFNDNHSAFEGDDFSEVPGTSESSESLEYDPESSSDKTIAEPTHSQHTKTSAVDDDLEFYFDEDFDPENNQTASITEHNDSNEHYDEQKQHPIEGFDENLESLISDDDIDSAMTAKPSYKQEIKGFIDGIQSAPVEMNDYSSAPKFRWLWKALAIALLLTLALQFIIFRFDSLSKNPSYRSFFISACQTIGCQVPELIDISQIRSSNLIVRSHPTTEDALLVDVILINNASFEQAYPTLQMTFSTLDNRTIAGSEFTPRQYLRGELAGSQRMPSKQPIQISLAIEDPGAEAVNYQLNIIGANLPSN